MHNAKNKCAQPSDTNNWYGRKVAHGIRTLADVAVALASTSLVVSDVVVMASDAVVMASDVVAMENDVVAMENDSPSHGTGLVVYVHGSVAESGNEDVAAVALVLVQMESWYASASQQILARWKTSCS